MDGYLPHLVIDWPDAREGDALAAKLSAAHCGPDDEDRSLTARIAAVADRLAGRRLDVLEGADAKEAYAALVKAVEGLEYAA